MNTLAADIVYAVLKDLTGRRGIRQAYDEIENDIRKEIHDDLVKIVTDLLEEE